MFISGYLIDELKNYKMAFIIFGIPPIAAAFFLCLIYIVNTIPTPEGATDGASEGASKGSPKGAPEGSPEGAPEGMQNTSEFEMGRLHRPESHVTPHNGA